MRANAQVISRKAGSECPDQRKRISYILCRTVTKSKGGNQVPIVNLVLFQLQLGDQEQFPMAWSGESVRKQARKSPRSNRAKLVDGL